MSFAQARSGPQLRVSYSVPKQEAFLAAGEASLATRTTTGDGLESERLKAKLGEMLLERELLEAKIAALEAQHPLARRRSRP